MPGVVRYWGPHLYRSAFHASTPQEECERALQHLRDLVAVEGPGTIAAIILESVVGTNGVLVPRTATSPACARSATSTASS